MRRCHNLVPKVRGVFTMKYGYCRVSTKGQLEGNSIEETVRKLQRETKLSEDLIRYILKEQVMA